MPHDARPKRVPAAAAAAALAFVTASVVVRPAAAIDNGLGLTPPRGWRSWNQFQCTINQSLVEAQYAALIDRSREVDGTPTSLLDLGYHTAGIDDCWQKCNSGPGGVGFHNASGYPVVDDSLFPDMAAMTAKARSLGLKAGWYGNNCHCSEQRLSCRYDHRTGADACFAGDVQATLDLGFQSIKLDGCGDQKNVTHYAALFNATGKQVLIENCHNGSPTYPVRDRATGEVDCPMNFFRSSTDIRPTFGSILINLQSTRQFNEANLTGPGCFAYPDMLEVGVTNSQRTAAGCVDGVPSPGCTLSVVEARTHFNAWCIVSAPLVLGNDLTDKATMDAVWPVVSNREAIAVNERWAGDAGTLVAQSNTTVHLSNCSWFNDDGCDHPSWMVWKKLLAVDAVDDRDRDAAGDHAADVAASDGKRSAGAAKNALPGQAAEGWGHAGDVLGDNAVAAVLLMNNADAPQDVAVDFAQAGIECAAAGCAVRDLDTHQDLGVVQGGFTAEAVPSHAARFVLVGRV